MGMRESWITWGSWELRSWKLMRVHLKASNSCLERTTWSRDGWGKQGSEPNLTRNYQFLFAAYAFGILGSVFCSLCFLMFHHGKSDCPQFRYSQECRDRHEECSLAKPTTNHLEKFMLHSYWFWCYTLPECLRRKRRDWCLLLTHPFFYMVSIPVQWVWVYEKRISKDQCC